MLTITIALALAASAAAEQQEEQWTYRVQSTYGFQDYLPLAVGNSWTFMQAYSDSTSLFVKYEEVYPEYWNADGHFAISVLRTEVIDTHTYYVMSEAPTAGWPPMPGHFIAGKKLRWDGSELKEHDGTSERSVYRFSTTGNDYEYSIPETEGDTVVKASGGPAGTHRIPTQHFYLEGWHEDGGRHIDWIAGFGLRRLSETIWEDDYTTLANSVRALQALLYEESGSQDTTRTTRRVTIGHASRSVAGQGPGPVTTTSESSWGRIKEGRTQ